LLDGVEYELVRLGEAIETITPPKKLPTDAFEETGKYPIIDQSQNAIAGYSNDDDALVKISSPVVVFGDHTCAVKYLDAPFIQGADGIKILKVTNKLNPKYLYYYLLASPIESNQYQRHFSELKRKEIPLPSIADQARIVAELDKEQTVIDAAKGSISLMQGKIARVFKRLGG
jgi:type I restriction enzyme M protein